MQAMGRKHGKQIKIKKIKMDSSQSFTIIPYAPKPPIDTTRCTYPNPLYGDLNCDGEVTFLEAFTVVANIGLTSAIKGSPVTWADGDFDGDGIVSFYPDAFEAVANIGAKI